MEAKLRQIIHSLRILFVPIHVDGSGFELLRFVVEFMKLDKFNHVDDLQEKLLATGKQAWKLTNMTDEAQDMRQKVCEALVSNVSQEAPQRTDLPVLPFPIPPITAPYRELWDLFHMINEVEFIKEYLRTVPNGINMSVKYSKNKNVPILDRRKLVWGECEKYLKTKYIL